jgi:GR25 family glycosyltransferase involved in LPS biosynthesis
MIPTYIINLKERTDRKQHVVNEVTKIPKLSYTIVDAIRDNTGTCFASHLKCIQLAKDNKLPYVLILEDDCIFTTECVDVLNTAINELQSIEWDMLYLGANLNAHAYSFSKSLIKLSGAYTTHAYMVHERFYDTILNLNLDVEIDVCYSKLMTKHDIFMCDPIIAYQLPSHSDIQHGFRDYNQAMFNNYLKYKS